MPMRSDQAALQHRAMTTGRGSSDAATPTTGPVAGLLPGLGLPPRAGLLHGLGLQPGLALLLVLALALGGCAAGRPAEPAAAASPTVPARWSSATPGGEPGAQAPSHWWTIFDDPGLSRVIEQALARNPDLATAALTVRQARLQAQLALQNRRPRFDGSLSAQARRTLDEPRATTRSSTATASVGYEVDLWGRLGSLVDAADWTARATAADRQSAALALSATTAELYWRIGYLHDYLTSTEESLSDARRTRELVLVQYQAGGVSSLELSESEQTILNQEATQLALQQQLIEARHALALLLDLPPGSDDLAVHLPSEPRRLPAGPLPTVAPGLPASLLGRRPDLLAAEHRLRAALADQQATAASFYPALTLTGALGTGSATLHDVLRNPFALLGVGIDLPFLNPGEVRIRNEMARADYEVAVIAFRGTLHRALEEVENALSARQSLLGQEDRLARSLQAARQTEALYEVRYRNGAVALRVWLDAQEARRRAQLALIENRLQQLSGLATLCKALGGSLVEEAGSPLTGSMSEDDGRGPGTESH